MPTGREEYCDGPGCGYLRPIVRTRFIRRTTTWGGFHLLEVRLCAECAAKEDRTTQDAANFLGKPLVDTTEQIRGMWEDEQAKRAMPPEPPGAAVTNFDKNNKPTVPLVARQIPKRDDHAFDDEIRFARDAKFFVRGALFATMIWGTMFVVLLHLLGRI